MKPAVTHFLEPKLLFGRGREAIDPRMGMLAHGPSGLDVESGERRRIRAGAIGMYGALAQLRRFLDELSGVISPGRDAAEKPWKLEFPGLGQDGPLGFDIVLDKRAVLPISEKEEASVLASGNRKERITSAFDLYESKMADLQGLLESPVDILFFPLSQRLIDECKDPHYDTERIVYERRTMDRRRAFEPAPLFDFHNALKVAAYTHNFTCQVLRPGTLTFAGTTQDPATVAWNFAAGAYYKATGTPWKLADIDDRTCIVGISFYQEMGDGVANMRTSMAHVYVRDAESQVIRGKPFVWREEDSREPSLDEGHAEELLRDVVNFFETQRQTPPRRVVVHKSSPFTPAEVAGFNRAVPPGVQADFVHIEAKPGVRFFHKGEGYPPVRGTAITAPGGPTFLYTVGFVPALQTYMGSTVPDPIAIRTARLDTDIDQIVRDIMALTKLDWNSTEFSTREPVTLSVSRKVGEILAETVARGHKPPTSYRHFM